MKLGYSSGKYQIKPIFPSNLELDLDLEKGLIDFDSLKKKNPNTNDVVVEIQPKVLGRERMTLLLMKSPLNKNDANIQWT
jgi:hypothetical protein